MGNALYHSKLTEKDLAHNCLNNTLNLITHYANRHKTTEKRMNELWIILQP